jgi:F-type H+-transporting ATPase subunit alpha
MEEQVVGIYSGIHGWLDKIPVSQVSRFHDELREHLRTEGDILEAIRTSGDLADDVAAKLEKELERFVHGFNVEEEKGLAG